MLSSEASCSDCKIELVERRWTQLLLKWINKCISTTKVRKLNPQSLADVMTKYKKDICDNDFDRAMLCTDDVEPFIKYKYPILRLRYLAEESDIPKRLYITTSIILYHCCVNSQTGAVDEDFCKKLTKYEQELILKFCENLCSMEVTLNNVESAIKDAFDIVGIHPDTTYLENSVSSDTAAQASSESTNIDSIATMQELPSDGNIHEMVPLKLPALNFNSSITVLPSVMAETSTYSDLMSESDNVTVAEKHIYVDSDEINVYALGSKIEKTNRVKIREDLPTLKEMHADRDNDSAQSEQNRSDEFAPAKHRVNRYGPDKRTEKFTLTHEDENTAADSSDLASLDKFHGMSDNVYSNDSLADCLCGEPGPASAAATTKPAPAENKSKKKFSFAGLNSGRLNWKMYVVAVALLFLMTLVIVLSTVPFLSSENPSLKTVVVKLAELRSAAPGQAWQCKKNICQKVYQLFDDTFSSYSRCSLVCMGPQLWPYPIGYTQFSKTIVALATGRLEYKFQSLPSEAVHIYLAEAFKLFIANLARLEKSGDEFRNHSIDLPLRKIYIQIDVETDPEPRMRLNTEEAYQLKIETIANQIVIKLTSSSFCGVRHGLETLSQLILLDQSTGNLITLSDLIIKDAPSYRYRGLMIDTARNYIPLTDLMRTVDAMATVKLNTFHWRISDVTSFPLLLPKLPNLFENGAYSREMVYTKEDVKALVSRAGFRGIRVLIEVAAPGPVGRPWSWSTDVTCPAKNDNFTCDNILCLRLKIKDSVFKILGKIYAEILEMTKVDDIFHLSDGIFSLTNCFFLIEEREGFLDKALDTLKQANKGFMPQLPVVWYTHHLLNNFAAKTWERFGVQLNEIKSDEDENYLSKFKVIHSTKWDLSCQVEKQRCKKYRTWQEMYSWKSWRNIDVFTIEGGEAILWTDLVNSGNLDVHLWPRAAAVAERLWSDMVVNVTASGPVYVRLDNQRWRMQFHGFDVQPIWPVWCSFNPAVCLKKLQTRRI